MMRATKVVLALLGAIAIASTAAGESTQEALQWLGRMADVYSGGPLSYGYEAHTIITDMGQTATAKMRGRSTQSDRSHFRIEVTTEMTVPRCRGADEGPTARGFGRRGHVGRDG